MLSFLKGLASTVSNDVIYSDLSRLNKLGGKTGDKAADYVKTGNNGTVLSTLSNANIPDDLLSPPEYAIAQDAPSRKRRKFFLDADPYDTALVARYAEVLAAARAKRNSDYGLAGPKTADPRLRVFFGEAFKGTVASTNSWPRKPRDAAVTGLTPGKAIAIGDELGIPASDVVALLLWDDAHWQTEGGEHYRKLVNMKAFLADNPDLIVQSTKLLNASSRAALIDMLRGFSLCEKEPFLSLVFDFAGLSAKSVRESALNALLSMPGHVVESHAADLLKTGTVSVREGMVALLGKLGTDVAKAALQERLKTEKTARVVSSIENALAALGASDKLRGQEGHEDDAAGYTAIDGDRVDIGKVRRVEDDPSVRFGKDKYQEVENAVAAYNENALRVNEELKKKKQRWGHWQVVQSPSKLAGAILDLFNTGQMRKVSRHDQHPYHFLRTCAPQLFNEMLDAVPLKRQIQISVNASSGGYFHLRGYLASGAPAPILGWLASADGDLRVLEDILIGDKHKTNLGSWRQKEERVYQRGDLLFKLMPEDSWMAPELDSVSDEALWPLVAENFAVMDQALGLAPKGTASFNKALAVRLLQRLPKTPLRYFGPLLEIATGEGKTGRAEARVLLADVEQVDERLIALLDDSRQAIRAGAAEWLSARDCSKAVKPMKARLKKEKSELARAALLTALQDLGEDLSSFVGPAALVKEAEAGLKKAKLDKLDWLGLDHLPKLKWRSGKTVPDEVVKWWVFLANKLKQPGGNSLFEIYLDQLDPASAEALSNWIFDSWIAYDTAQPDEAEGTAYAQANVKQRFAQWSKWWDDLTEAATFQMLKNEITGQYLNSGAANKGMLALATRVPPTRAADRVRQYLRQHGKRTSQATSLLELLSAKGDAVSLQVVISAATRLKQKGVQAKAGEMIEAVAEARGWSMQELADRTIPTGGLDDDGIVELPCGPDAKPYKARLGDGLQLIVTNPDGKTIKALPSNDDENTKDSKKQLSTSKKEIKQVVKAQSDRLYEALCAERSWPVSDWKRDFNDHPVMRRLIERVVWLGLDENGEVRSAFRPTSDGEFTDEDDNPVDPAEYSTVRLAHGALLDDAGANAWKEHLKDYEVSPLFGQFDRPLLRLPDEMLSADQIEDRKGWVTDAFTIRGAASRLGYDRGEALDGGFFCEYVKPFKSANILAVIEFSGNGLPEENVAAAMKALHFTTSYSSYNVQKMRLKDVPPVLLSECWNDYREMAAKGQFDPDWEKKMPW